MKGYLMMEERKNRTEKKPVSLLEIISVQTLTKRVVR
jgi:hypothetical protein